MSKQNALHRLYLISHFSYTVWRSKDKIKTALNLLVGYCGVSITMQVITNLESSLLGNKICLLGHAFGDLICGMKKQKANVCVKYNKSSGKVDS